MWEFLLAVYQQTGVLGLLCVAMSLIVCIVIRMFHIKDKRVGELNQQLLAMSDKRLEDVIEDRDKYEDLSKDIHKTINLLIKVFKKQSGLNGE